MKDTLATLVRRVLASSALLSTGSSSLSAAPSESLETTVAGPETATLAPSGVTIRRARPRLVLKRGSDYSMELVSSHRSHRSHSSHRSHYSSSSGTSRPPARPRQDTSRAPGKAAPLASLAPTLGSRVLAKGMKGADVMELMRLLVAHSYLDREEISTDSTFNDKVESAVKMFQIARGVEPDGKVGPALTILLKRSP